MELAHLRALEQDLPAKFSNWHVKNRAKLGLAAGEDLPEGTDGKTLKRLPIPTLPRGVETTINVSNQTELTAAINAAGPRKIVLQNNIICSSWNVIGGQHGNNAATTGRDVHIDGKGFALLNRGLNIEKGCNRILIENLAIYSGAATLVPGVTKSAINDPLTIVGMNAGKEPPKNITLRKCAFGFGGDMNVQIEGDRVWLDRCMSFHGLANPNHPKHSSGPPHSKLYWVSASNLVQNAGRRLRVMMTGCIGAFGEDRCPRVSGAVDFYAADNWFCGCYLGANIDDHHTSTGYLRATFEHNRFTTCQRVRSGAAGNTQPFSVFMGDQAAGRLRLSNNVIDGVPYDSPASAWDVIDHQYSFGGAYAGTETPVANRSLNTVPVGAAYSPSADAKAYAIANAGASTRDAIQQHVVSQMQLADAGHYTFTLLADEDDLTVGGKAGWGILA